MNIVENGGYLFTLLLMVVSGALGYYFRRIIAQRQKDNLEKMI